MLDQFKSIVDLKGRNRMFLTIIWISITLLVLVELLNYVLYLSIERTELVENYALRYVITPAAAHLLIGIVSAAIYKALNKKRPVLTSYSLIFGFTALVHETALIHYSIGIISAIYAFPIFLSILFYRRRLTLIVAITCIALYAPQYFLFLPNMPGMDYRFNYMDYTATLIYLIASYVISFFIMTTFRELLAKVMKSQKESRVLKKRLELDPFTKLYNRQAFDKYLASELEACQSGECISTLMVIDIDDFKAVNDTYGHAFGDSVILALVEVIRESIRESDHAFRYGGEEFCVLLRAHGQNAYAVADKIRTRFNGLVFCDEQEQISCSISIGVREYDSSIQSGEKFFSEADDALYKAKQTGKNRVCVAGEGEKGPEEA